ncbi:MAG: outer membrane beta-barrel family protein [Prevotella sp.]|nr:outer membrane beta-barrel family protein [Prevotella sp.]
MKQIIAILLLMIPFCANAQDEYYHGIVIDKDTKENIPYANVSLLEKQDSSVAVGCTTDSLGKFFVPVSKEENRLLKVSCVGYKAQCVLPAENMIVMLERDEKQIGEVVIKSHRPVYRMMGGSLISTIENTALSRLGTAKDVLAQLPFITASGETIGVIGRGAPLFYINGRKMRGNELQEIQSYMIKEVKIDMNPGAKYPSGTGAVIHITTHRPPNDGLAGYVTAYGKQADYFSHYEGTSLNYRKGNLDVFFNGYYDFAKTKGSKSEDFSFPYNNNDFRQGWKGYTKHTEHSYKLAGGFNYLFSKEHSLGLQYDFTDSPDSKTWIPLDNYINDGMNVERFRSDLENKSNFHSHSLYLYYTNKFNDMWSLNVDATYRKAEGNSHNITIEDRRPTDNMVETRQDVNSDLYAVKATVTNRFKFGEISWGTEDTYTKSYEEYLMNHVELSQLIPNNQSESRQTNLSAFLTYQNSFGRLGMQAGVRYEYTLYDYYNNGIKQEDDSKTYGNIFPSLSLSCQFRKMALSLNYSVDVSRPSYNMLTNGVQYINSFLYLQGNPTLKNNYNHNISLMGAYRNLQFMVTYCYRDNYLLRGTSLIQGRPVMTDYYVNHDKHTFQAMLVYSPVISFWRPSFTVGVNAQHLNYNGKSYSGKPIGGFTWKNLLALPDKWQIVCNVDWYSSGNYDIYERKSVWYVNSYVTKEWKQWRFTMGANDVFGTNKKHVILRDGNVMRVQQTESTEQCVYMTVLYNIKAFKSRYKGKTAGQSEIKRL